MPFPRYFVPYCNIFNLVINFEYTSTVYIIRRYEYLITIYQKILTLSSGKGSKPFLQNRIYNIKEGLILWIRKNNVNTKLASKEYPELNT